jgi:hypothetical protein
VAIRSGSFWLSRVEAQIVTYEINKRWKEDLVYTEAGHEFSFWYTWFTPHVITVPSAAYWPRATPEWMHDRRTEILGRLQAWADDNNASLSETDIGYTSTRGRRPWVFGLGPRRDGGPLSGKHLAILMNSDERSPGRSLSDYDEWARLIHDHQGRIGSGISPRDAAWDLKRQLDADGIHDVDWKGSLPR